jgi:NAD(P)-dependent dehydrogenase (short-subunit alcohol dehydrogenase family)
MASRGARLDLDDLDMAAGYAPYARNGASKLANILFTRELHHRFHGQGLSSAAFHPGIVATSFGAKDGPWITRLYGTALARALFSSPRRGGSRLVRLAEGTPGVDWRSGQYWVRGRVGRTSPQADEPEVARRLWEASAEMVGLG